MLHETEFQNRVPEVLPDGLRERAPAELVLDLDGGAVREEQVHQLPPPQHDGQVQRSVAVHILRGQSPRFVLRRAPDERRQSGDVAAEDALVQRVRRLPFLRRHRSPLRRTEHFLGLTRE